MTNRLQPLATNTHYSSLITRCSGNWLAPTTFELHGYKFSFAPCTGCDEWLVINLTPDTASSHINLAHIHSDTVSKAIHILEQRMLASDDPNINPLLEDTMLNAHVNPCDISSHSRTTERSTTQLALNVYVDSSHPQGIVDTEAVHALVSVIERHLMTISRDATVTFELTTSNNKSISFDTKPF